MDRLRPLLKQKTFYLASFLMLNGMHTKALDILFICLTFLGDGLFSIVIAFFLFVARMRRLSLYIITTYLVSGVAAIVLKRIFMAPRPKEIISRQLYASFFKWNNRIRVG